MLKIGRNDNLVLVSAKKNDKGTLSITVKESAVDALAVLNGSGTLDQRSQDFLLFPVKAKNSLGEIREATQILGDLNDLKEQLRLILSQYLTNDKITLNPTKGITTITDGASLMSEITKQSVLDQAYNNLVGQFIEQITPFLGENGKKLNWFFIAQNAAKPFPKLRSRYVSSYPFVESPDVPKSKLQFTTYEIKNKLDGSGTVIADTPNKEEAKDAAALFS